MNNKSIAIAISIALIILFGLFFHNFIANIINGHVIKQENVENHYFRISNSSNEIIKEVNNGLQNNS